MEKIKQLGLILLIFAGAFGMYFVLESSAGMDNNNGSSLIKAEVPKTDVNVKFELKSIGDRPAWYAKQMRPIIKENLYRLSEENCEGLFFDSDEDKQFDTHLFGEQFGGLSKFVYHYNFCSFSYDQREVISIIATTKELLTVKTLGNDGRKYVPSVLFKIDKSGNILKNEQVLIAEEDILEDL